jgi:hypothetical protein
MDCRQTVASLAPPDVFLGRRSLPGLPAADGVENGLDGDSTDI